MAAGDAHVVNNFKEQLLLKIIDCDTDTFKVAMYTDVYSSTMIDGAAPAYSATNEIVAANYTAGGVTVTGLVVAQDDTNDRASWDFNDPAWTSLGAASPKRAVLYDDTTTPKHQCQMWEINTDSNGGNYTLQLAAAGALLLS